MKTILVLLAFSCSQVFAGPPVQIMRTQQAKVQPCVTWFKNGQCAVLGAEYDAVDRAQANVVVAILLERIVKLENEVQKLKEAQK